MEETLITLRLPGAAAKKVSMRELQAELPVYVDAVDAACFISRGSLEVEAFVRATKGRQGFAEDLTGIPEVRYFLVRLMERERVAARLRGSPSHRGYRPPPP